MQSLHGIAKYERVKEECTKKKKDKREKKRGKKNL